MNPISFRSTYAVKNIPLEKFSKFQRLAQATQDIYPNETRFLMESKLEDPKKALFSMKGMLIAPNCADNEIEAYCKHNGINYTKHDTKDLLNPSSIKSRIAPPKKGMHLVYVDSEKLETLSYRQNSNLDHCKNVYDDYYKYHTEMMLRKDDNIPVSTLYIIPNGSDEDFIKYVDCWGPDLLNSNQIYIGLAQSDDEPDHCMYFAMKELGMKKIPVYVNQATRTLCEKLGLLE